MFARRLYALAWPFRLTAEVRTTLFYLTELQKHEAELKAGPQDWMPWNCRATLAASTEPALR